MPVPSLAQAAISSADLLLHMLCFYHRLEYGKIERFVCDLQWLAFVTKFDHFNSAFTRLALNTARLPAD
jgi:hypothetical protein